MQPLVWRNFKIEVPDDWEMLQFSKDLNKGGCAFGDRYQIVLEFSWQKVEKKPDMKRTVSDYIHKLQYEKKTDKVQNLKQGHWLGFTGKIQSVLSSRFMRFFNNESCVVQLVFVWPGKRNENLEAKILKSVKEEPAGKNGYRHWRAFGMDAFVSDELSLKDCVIKPARAKMIFGNSSLQIKEEFLRLGMLSRWFEGTVKDWLVNQIPTDVKIHTQFLSDISGHRVENISGSSPVSGLKKFLGRRIKYNASAWICPRDKRLYFAAVDNYNREGRKNDCLAGQMLLCCDHIKRLV